MVSAKTGEGVEIMFNEICQKLIKTAAMKKKERDQTKLGTEAEKKKKKCCG